MTLQTSWNVYNLHPSPSEKRRSTSCRRFVMRTISSSVALILLFLLMISSTSSMLPSCSVVHTSTMCEGLCSVT